MRKSFKTEINPSEEQKIKIRKTIGTCRFIYNFYLAHNKNIDEARLAAKAIVTSPLFKSAVFGGDPNWGRIVSAIGYSGADVSADTVTIAIANKQDEVSVSVPLYIRSRR